MRQKYDETIDVVYCVRLLLAMESVSSEHALETADIDM